MADGGSLIQPVKIAANLLKFTKDGLRSLSCPPESTGPTCPTRYPFRSLPPAIKARSEMGLRREGGRETGLVQLSAAALRRDEIAPSSVRPRPRPTTAILESQIESHVCSSLFAVSSSGSGGRRLLRNVDAFEEVQRGK